MKNEESNKPFYYDFEPYCEWKRDDEACIFKDADILEIKLQGFKKEELKTEMKNDGFLYISGERPVGKSLIKRFNKKIDVSKYEIEGIEADFEAGKIHLRLPLKSSAISFLKIGRDNQTVGILRFNVFKKIIIWAMAVALAVAPLVFYLYKYTECIIFRNWFK